MHGLHWSAKFFFAIGVCVVGLVILLLAFEVRDAYDSYYPGFNKQEWLSARPESEPNPRDQMVSDIIAHKLKKGMSRQAVIALLGPPDGSNSEADSALIYRTGWNVMGPDYREPFYLTIYFTSNRQLSQTEWKACSSLFTTCEIK